MAGTKPSNSDVATPLTSAIATVLIAILVFTPLVRAGNAPLAELISQMLALVLIGLLLWSPSRLPLRPIEWLLLGFLALVPLVYLLPLPSPLVDALPGRALYSEAMAMFDDEDGAAAWKPLTLVPFATVSAGLALLLPLAVFVASRSLDRERAELVVKIMLGIAALQALFGLLQFGVAQGGLEESWGIKAGRGGSATGTYVNRNHLGGLLELTFPVALALFFFHLGRRDLGRRTGHWGRKAAFWASTSGHATIIYGVLALLLMTAAVFTRSRTGIFLVIVGLVLSTIVFSRRIGGSNVYGPAGTIISLLVAGAIAIGLAPVLNRFSLANVDDDMRWTLFEETLQGAAGFFPFGSGPGTFQAAFPPVQPIELGRFLIDYSHNDYLQWFFETGLVGILAVSAVVLLFVRQWVRIARFKDWSRGRFLQTGAGIGLLLIAFHELVDFNLYIPANQVAFALLAGVFFMSPQSMASDHAKQDRRRRTPRLEPSPGTAMPPHRASGPIQPTPEQIRNPFLDP